MANAVQRLKAHWGIALLCLAVVLHLLMQGSLFWGYLDPLFDNADFHPKGIDFFAIYEGGHNALRNRSLFFYDPTDTSLTPYHTPYRYLPFLAYVGGLPLNAVPAWSAYWAWVAFSELLLVVTAYATWRVAGRGSWALVAAAMWFVFTPYYLEMYMGQFSFLMAVALFWVGVGVARGREAIAGLPWIFSLVAKSSSAVLFPLVVRLGWGRTLSAASIIVGLSMLYFAFRPGDLDYFVWLNFDRTLGETGVQFLDLDSQEREGFFYVDRELRYFQYHPGELGGVGFLTNALLTRDPDSATVPGAYTAALVGVVVGCSLMGTFLVRKNDALVLFAIWSSVFFLIYIVWEHHYVMLLPAFVLLVALRPAIRPWALLAFLFIALPTPYWLMNNVWNTGPPPPDGALISRQEVWPAWGVVLHHAAKAVPVFAFWAYLVATELRSGLRVPGGQFVRATWGRLALAGSSKRAA